SSGERGGFGGARAGGGTLVPSSRALLVCEKASVALRAVAKARETGRKSMVASFVYLSTTFTQAHALKHTLFKHAKETAEDALLFLLRFLLLVFRRSGIGRRLMPLSGRAARTFARR